MLQSYVRILIFSIFILGFTSCIKENKLPEIQDMDSYMGAKFIRFDSILTFPDTLNIENQVKKIYVDYPDFMPYFVENIIQTNSKDTNEVVQLLKNFKSNRDFKQVNADVLRTFSNMDSVTNSIKIAYYNLNKEFPEIKTPPVYFFVSGFNRAIILEDKFVGVGLDLYLGNTYPKYAALNYQYMLFNMRPESIPSGLISGILFKHFRFDGNKDRLLEQMLYRGKIMYILSELMPDQNPNVLMGYSRFQWEWCRKYEDKIWNTIVGQKDLYSTDQLLINKYLNDAPFTAPVSQESPGRIGTWAGWQIVKNYMKKNDTVSIQTLIKTTDYQLLLQQSGYEP